MMPRKILRHPFFIFPVFACLLFWPISLQLLTFKNDALSYYYPVRTLISDALNNGELPLWTPFINLGYPLHADLQSGAWNPVIWIFAFITKYSLAGFHFEFLFYITFAGIGFYYLCRQLGTNKIAAILLGFAYQASGFMTDSVQFFNCISAACYLPFVVLFFLKLLEQNKLGDGLLLATFLWLLFTGGYPSLFIITIYSLLAIWIYRGVKSYNRKLYFRKTFFSLGIAAVAFVLLSLPAAVSFYQHLHHIERGSGQALSTVLENSMNPTTTLSLVSPFSTTAHDAFLDSSILMRSIYMGLIPLVFIIWALTRKVGRQGNFLFFFFTALLMLGLAWGEYFFLRQAAYYVLPLMDSFRHPGLFRLFFIFFMLLAAGETMQAFYSRQKNLPVSLKKIVQYFLWALAIAWLIMLIWKGAGLWQQMPGSDTLAEKFYRLSFSQRFLLQIPFALFSLLTLYWLLNKGKIVLLPVLAFAELFVVTQFNLPITVAGAVSFADMEATLHRNPAAFPLPVNLPIEQSIAPYSKPNYISNLLQFEKIIGRNDIFITPGNLITQDSFYYSNERANAFKKPVVYLDDSTANGYSLQGIRIVALSANKLVLQVETGMTKELVYQQNYYPGWICYANDTEIPIRTIYTTEMAVTVPAGSNKIEFRYTPAWIKTCFYISVCSLAAMLIYLAFTFFAARRSKKRRMAGETI